MSAAIPRIIIIVQQISTILARWQYSGGALGG
jgi:hypothetical protein